MSKFTKLLLSTIISLIGIYLAFHGENFGELMQTFKMVKWIPFWVSIALLLFSCIIRAIRWHFIVLPVEKIPVSPLFGSVMIGYFGNMILPFRMGEFLRSHSISKKYNISFSEVFGTIILERIMDLVAVVVIFFMIIPWFPFHHKNLEIGIMIFTSATILIVFIVILMFYLRLLDRIKSWKIFQTRYGSFLFHIVENIYNGLTLLSKTHHTLWIIFTSILIWLMYYISTYLVLKSCSIDIGYLGASIILIIGGLIISIPALPGAAGTYDAGIKYGLIAVYAINSEKALAYALISHAGMFFPYLLVGGLYFILDGIHLKDIKNKSINP